MSTFRDELVARLGADRVGEQVPLARFTTFRVGGPADLLIDTRTSDELVDVLRLAARFQVPVTPLGGGSNVLIADAGIRGLVVRLRAAAIERDGQNRVRAESGATVNGLVRWTVARGLAGLEAWAGTPGTIGGGVYGNVHYAGRLLGDLVVRVRLVDRAGQQQELPGTAMEFGYDRSRLQRTGEILLSAVFRVEPGHDPAALREVARRSLTYRKCTQPLNMPSAGCVFRNPERGRDPVPDDLPASAGALIDRAGLKGASIGGAQVSPEHANFIVNVGDATAADVRALIERCRQRVAERFGVALMDEIVYLGEFE